LSSLVYELQEFFYAWPSKSPVAWRQTLRQCTDGKGIGIKVERLDELDELNANLLWAECLESFDLLLELLFGVFSLLLSLEHWALSFTSSFCSQIARAVAVHDVKPRAYGGDGEVREWMSFRTLKLKTGRWPRNGDDLQP
jgi:hypothetical protein